MGGNHILGKLRSDDSFIDLYLRYTQNQESPEAFHLWVGLSILAAALGRKCYIDRGYYKLYPNLFTILVAGSARCRKSTAINIGIRLLEGIETTKVVQGKITPEKFINDLADSVEKVEGANGAPPTYKVPATLVHSSELSVLLTKQSYGEPLIHILTDLFDCPDTWTYKTKNRGESQLRDVFICILAATTPDGVAKGIPESALHEGFASRVLFCYQPDTERRNAFPVLTAQELKLYIKLREMLQQRSKIAGQFTLTPEAHEWFGIWYNSHMEDLIPERRLEGMYGRKHDHLLRLAMVLAASNGEIVIDPRHLEAALLAINDLETTVAGAFSQLGGSEATPHIERAKILLRKHGKMKWVAFCRAMAPADFQIIKIVRDSLFNTEEMGHDQNDPTMIIWKGD